MIVSSVIPYVFYRTLLSFSKLFLKILPKVNFAEVSFGFMVRSSETAKAHRG
eukprot:TRINITY_DN15195_c0_g1_i1.p2 TRINITY_DN15195_c0_g1~~TRINITY_DN15195_c0_g1_i1.p2  ORF type:complete len:52 (+),score=9.50 TRINITY_DN15195_c0_g1_i1:347-502(+)